MNTNEQLKQIVRDKYREIAEQSKERNAGSCCGATSCGTEVYNIMSDDYTRLEGYEQDADLGLGCGIPTEFAQIKEGDVVIDLGSGAGNDAFVARRATGPGGKVIGIDFTPAMIQRARANAEKVGYHNVEFREGDIESIPVSSDLADVILSNCVLNLVPDKKKVFAEIFRVLKPGGHFSISDVVLLGELPNSLKQAAEMYAGCVAGAIQQGDYMDLIRKQGFTDLKVQKQKQIHIPDSILLEYLTPQEHQQYLASGVGIYSLTVFARKPVLRCEPGQGCC